MANDKIKVAGRFYVNHYRDGELIHKDEIGSPNVVTTEGRNHMLAAELLGGAQLTTWYLSIFTNDVTPSDALNAGNVVASLGEITTYGDDTNRIVFTGAADTGNVKVDNSASPATFTMTAGATARGAFLISSQAIGAGTGTLMAAARFSSDRGVIASDQLVITYEVGATST